jgi:hypothetical protein
VVCLFAVRGGFFDKELFRIRKNSIDDRVLKLRTSQDALQLAQNAKEFGNDGLSEQALKSAIVLRANEEGYKTPAEIEIATAPHHPCAEWPAWPSQ